MSGARPTRSSAGSARAPPAAAKLNKMLFAPARIRGNRLGLRALYPERPMGGREPRESLAICPPPKAGSKGAESGACQRNLEPRETSLGTASKIHEEAAAPAIETAVGYI